MTEESLWDGTATHHKSQAKARIAVSTLMGTPHPTWGRPPPRGAGTGASSRVWVFQKKQASSQNKVQKRS